MSLPVTSGDVRRPPSYLDEGIRELQKLFSHVKTCLTWQNPQQTLTVTAAWWILCLHFWLVVIYILPLLPIVWVAHTWSPEQKTPLSPPSPASSSSSKLEHQTQSTALLVSYATLFEQKVFQWVECLQWSKDPLRTRRTFVVLVYAYILWVAGHQLVDTRHIFLAAGTLGLARQSPWFKTLLVKARYPVLRSVTSALFLGPLQQPRENNVLIRAAVYQEEFANADKRATEDASFTFSLYENQRAWPFGQWEAKTLPVERAPWTDDAHEPVPAKNVFTLPQPMDRTIIDTARPGTTYHKTWSWTWIDPEWRLDFSTAQVDELGWEYGTMAWTLFDRQPKKGFMSTRRRQWTRRARVVYHVEVKTSSSVPSSPISSTLSSTTANPAVEAAPQAPASVTTTQPTSPPQSPIKTSFHEPAFTSPPTSPRSSVYTFDLAPSRRDSFATASPAPRLSQSTVTVTGNHYPDMEEMRRRRGNSISARSTQLYASPILEDHRNRLSTASLDKRQRDSPKKPQQRREAVWKSIVRT